MPATPSNSNQLVNTPLSLISSEILLKAKLYSTGPDLTPLEGLFECIESIFQILDDDRTIDHTLISQKLLPVIRQIDFYTELLKYSSK